MKKRILAISLVVAMLAIAVIGGSLAYFTDTDKVTNTFTAGKVEISLAERQVDEYGVPAVPAEWVEGNKYKLIPGHEYTKDPTITVLEGSEETYLAAVVTVNRNLTGLIPFNLEGTTGYVDINKMISGGVMKHADLVNDGYGELSPVFANDTMGIYQKPITGEGGKITGHTFYVFFTKAYKAEDTVTLFDKLTVPGAATNEDIEALSGMNIEITAYGVQKDTFADCFTAATTAFPEVFVK